MAERVCNWLPAFRFLAPDGLDHRLTTLIGIATLPEVTGLVDELMKVADRAILSGQARRGRTVFMSRKKNADEPEVKE